MNRLIEKMKDGMSKLTDNIPKYTNDDMFTAIAVTAIIVSAVPVVEDWIKSYYHRKRLDKLAKKERKRRELYHYINETIDEVIEDAVADAVARNMNQAVTVEALPLRSAASLATPVTTENMNEDMIT